jgi:hypothetical protein
MIPMQENIMEMQMEWFDAYQICLNGHGINDSYEDAPQYNQNHCHQCGRPTIMSCQHCNTPIKGRPRDTHYLTGGYGTPPPPNFCHNCGAPYPWTEIALVSAQEYADEVDALTNDDKLVLKESLADLVRDTPKTQLAVTRFKKLMVKAGGEAASSFKSILINVITEAAKKTIWPTP